MTIIETLLKAKEYYEKGVTCTLRFHNLTKNFVNFDSIGNIKDFEAATPPPLFIKPDSFGDAILNASKFWSSTLNLFYTIKVNDKLYAIHINYIWEKETKGSIQIKILDIKGDTLYPLTENFVGLYKSFEINEKSIPFVISYMASGTFVEVLIREK